MKVTAINRHSKTAARHRRRTEGKDREAQKIALKHHHFRTLD